MHGRQNARGIVPKPQGIATIICAVALPERGGGRHIWYFKFHIPSENTHAVILCINGGLAAVVSLQQVT